MTTHVNTGLMRLAGDPSRFQCNGRIAVVANKASIDRGFQYTPFALLNAGLDVSMVFSPEHGFFQVAGYMATVGRDRLFGGLPVKSLYQDTEDDLLIPQDMLDTFDCLVFDLQDVGTRCYTYISHLVLLLRQLQGSGKRIVVLDRPNPIGGAIVEGPALARGWESFVGMLPVPMRHGLTVGETVRLALSVEKLDTDVEIVPMEGWHRAMSFDETGLAWVPPSPNMPTPKTALVYPGMVFLEATNVSEARGTTTPFEMFGAPFIRDPDRLAKRLNSEGLTGVHFMPVFFKPRFDKYEGQVCGGCALQVTNATLFRPLLTGLFVVSVLRDMYPGFRFLDGPYEFDDRGAAYLLAGDRVVYDFLYGKTTFSTLKDYFREQEGHFLSFRKDFLLYD